MRYERHKTAPSCSFHLWPWGSRWQLAERKHQARKADPGSEDSLFVAKHPEVLRSFFLFKKTPLPSTVSHFSSFILRELHLTLYLVAHDHQPLYLIDSTSFNQSSLSPSYRRHRVFPLRDATSFVSTNSSSTIDHFQRSQSPLCICCLNFLAL